jgi:GNAT superfamily N-acetyltransferase
MQFEFKIITADTIETVVPLVKKMSKPHITEAILKERFKEMITQNYECVGVYDADQLIGVSGLWFCTRHYSGRSVELDHVFIDDAYRNKGLGTQFINWIETYVKTKGYQAIELNAYIDNVPSQNFYEKDGFQKLGYHFVKKIG